MQCCGTGFRLRLGRFGMPVRSVTGLSAGMLRRRMARSAVAEGLLPGRHVCMRQVFEGNRSVGAAAEYTESLHRILPAALHGMAYLEEETVNLSGGFQLTHPFLAQQRTQHTVIAPQQLREEHAFARRLNDKGPELRYDQSLVRLQITFDCTI